jgi:hypothetical protein
MYCLKEVQPAGVVRSRDVASVHSLELASVFYGAFPPVDPAATILSSAEVWTPAPRRVRAR